MLKDRTERNTEVEELGPSAAEERKFEADSESPAAPDAMKIHLSAIGKVPLLSLIHI